MLGLWRGRTFLGDETLASRGQTNHDNAYPRIFDLDANTVSFCVRAVPGTGRGPHEVALRSLVQFRFVLGRIVLGSIGNQWRVCLYGGRHGEKSKLRWPIRT